MASPTSRDSSAGLPPEIWNPARRAAKALANPIQRFLSIEAASGVLLILATLAALLWANSSAGDSYHHLWHIPVGFRFGGLAVEHSLHYWVNEGLMTVFFFVVGLEIRREIYEGELSDLRRAALPLVAALGGVMMPAIIFTVINMGRAGAGGWAVPMATDIAFAVGVLTLLGSRVPNALRVLLLGLAVIDDIAAIIVIAVFFSAGLSLYGAGLAALGLVFTLTMRAIGVRTPLLYVLPGIVLWVGLAEAGIHQTLAGVILGLVTPVRPWFGPSGFAETTREHLDALDTEQRHEFLVHLDEINRARREAVSPAERLIHILHPWVAFVIMPLFALANAGVDLGGGDLSGDNLYLFLGVVLGLSIGKPIGIAGASLLSSSIGLTRRSEEMSKRGLVLVGTVGGIGFTMSLFIAELAFKSGPLLETAKLSVLVGSAIAMAIGLGLGVVIMKKNRPQ